MSRFKDEWNERHYNRMEELRERGVTGRAAEDLACKHADELASDMADQADYMRKAARET